MIEEIAIRSAWNIACFVMRNVVFYAKFCLKDFAKHSDSLIILLYFDFHSLKLITNTRWYLFSSLYQINVKINNCSLIVFNLYSVLYIMPFGSITEWFKGFWFYITFFHFTVFHFLFIRTAISCFAFSSLVLARKVCFPSNQWVPLTHQIDW